MFAENPVSGKTKPEIGVEPPVTLLLLLLLLLRIPDSDRGRFPELVIAEQAG